MSELADLDEAKGATPSMADMQSLMKAKAHELFNQCDTEEKGFITKRDMQRLQEELHLNPDQLENVFDSLDDDGNGYLTLEEFTEGFGSFLGVSFGQEEPVMEDQVDTFMDEEEKIDPQEELRNYKHMMHNIGAAEVFDDEPAVKNLWCRLRREDAEMAENLEDFLYRVSNDLKRTKTDFSTLEGALRNKTTSHDEEVRKLYEEMESQIRAEKAKVLAEEKVREKQMRDQMEKEIHEKDRQLQEMMSKQAELEEKIGHLNTIEAETKVENEKLMKSKEDLEESLYRSQISLDESRTYINQLRQQEKDEKRARAKAALQLSEGIALERETLVKQLDMLKSMNRKLQDDKDEAETRRMEEASPKDRKDKKGALARQGSVLSKYFDPTGVSKHSKNQDSIPEDVEQKEEAGLGAGLDGNMEKEADLMDIDDDIECDDDMYANGQSPSFIHPDIDCINNSLLNSSPNIRYRSDSEAEASDADSVDGPYKRTKRDDEEMTPSTQRAQPLGADGMADSGNKSYAEPVTLQRVFKVVVVGDSGVGKSSFLHRYCSNHFKASYAATIGVDFQIKPLNIEGHNIVLQLWDTAGQERFRSITKQYFRKADGVIVMYDVTSETTFTNVSHWMTSIEDGISDTVILLLIGNKNDLPEDDDAKAVKAKHGSRLADGYEALFYETSALTGENVSNAMEAMARKLKEKEDREIEKSLHLEEFVKKKRCCRK